MSKVTFTVPAGPNAVLIVVDPGFPSELISIFNSNGKHIMQIAGFV